MPLRIWILTGSQLGPVGRDAHMRHSPDTSHVMRGAGLHSRSVATALGHGGPHRPFFGHPSATNSATRSESLVAQSSRRADGAWRRVRSRMALVPAVRRCVRAARGSMAFTQNALRVGFVHQAGRLLLTSARVSARARSEDVWSMWPRVLRVRWIDIRGFAGFAFFFWEEF